MSTFEPLQLPGDRSLPSGAHRRDSDARADSVRTPISGSRASDLQATRQAWLREMERAQMLGWFQPLEVSMPLAAAKMRKQVAPYRHGEGLASSAATTHSLQPTAPPNGEGYGPAREPARPRMMAGLRLGSGVSFSSRLDAPRGFADSALTGGAAMSTTPMPPPISISTVPATGPALLQSVLLRLSLLGQPALVVGPEEIHASFHSPTLYQNMSPSRGGGMASDQSAMRLHAEWAADGLHLWIGIGGTEDEVEARMRALWPHLQQTLQAQGVRLTRLVCNGREVYALPTQASQANAVASAEAVAGLPELHDAVCSAYRHTPDAVSLGSLPDFRTLTLMNREVS